MTNVFQKVLYSWVLVEIETFTLIKHQLIFV